MHYHATITILSILEYISCKYMSKLSSILIFGFWQYPSEESISRRGDIEESFCCFTPRTSGRNSECSSRFLLQPLHNGGFGGRVQVSNFVYFYLILLYVTASFFLLCFHLKFLSLPVKYSHPFHLFPKFDTVRYRKRNGSLYLTPCI